jgi:NADP-dependent 3-hydroxy acid dehydrogenase YdfG
MMGVLDGRHALITGGGIGAAIARALASAATAVSIAGRRKTPLDEVATRLPKATTVVLWLCLPQASAINGQIIVISGGQT